MKLDNRSLIFPASNFYLQDQTSNFYYRASIIMNNNLIKQLRQDTGFGVMECKRALEEASGDMEAAKKILLKKGTLKAEEKASRKAGEGVIDAYIHNHKIGVLIEVACETDFVARNLEFRALVHDIAMQIASMNPQNIEELLAQSFIKDETLTIKQIIHEAVGKLGENIKIKRFVIFKLGEGDDA